MFPREVVSGTAGQEAAASAAAYLFKYVLLIGQADQVHSGLHDGRVDSCGKASGASFGLSQAYYWQRDVAK